MVCASNNMPTGPSNGPSQYHCALGLLFVWLEGTLPFADHTLTSWDIFFHNGKTEFHYHGNEITQFNNLQEPTHTKNTENVHTHDHKGITCMNAQNLPAHKAKRLTNLNTAIRNVPRLQGNKPTKNTDSKALLYLPTYGTN
jgi:hypothetical protein